MKISFTFLTVSLLLAGCAGIRMQDFHWEPAGGPYGQNVSALLVDTDSSTCLYAGLHSGEVYRSTDEGKTWRRWGTVGTKTAIHRLIQNPEEVNILYAATDSGVMVSSTRGKEWRLTGPSTSGALACRAIALDPWKPAVVYAGTSGKGLYKTSDGGRSWAPINAGGDSLLGSAEVCDVRIDPARPDIVYAAVSGSGIERSTDGGTTWRRLTPEFSITSSVTTHVIIHGKSGDTMLYATDTGKIFRSTNEGASWSLCRDGSETGRILTLVADPANPDLLYAGTESGLFQSPDFGATWVRMPGPLPLVATSVAVPQDKTTPARYAFGPGVGVQVSRNGGTTWSRADEGLGGASIDFITSDQTGQTVFACAGTALLRWTERSTSWEPATSGLTGGAITSLAFDADSPSVLFAASREGVFTSSDNGDEWHPMVPRARIAPTLIDAHPWIHTRMIASGEQGIFISTDKGRSWTEAKPLGNRIHLRALTYTPTNAGVIHAAADGIGIAATSDGGLRWEAARFGLKGDSIISVTIDDQDQQTYYAWTGRGGCYRSTNRGLEWNTFAPPWNAGDALLIAHDRMKPSSVLALVNGQDVYFSPSGGTSWFHIIERGQRLDASCLFWNATSMTAYVGTRDQGVSRLLLGPLIRELSNE